jgi:hypothetical protein
MYRCYCCRSHIFCMIAFIYCPVVYWRELWGVDGVGSGHGQVAGTCEYGNELSGSIKCGEFLD